MKRLFLLPLRLRLRLLLLPLLCTAPAPGKVLWDPLPRGAYSLGRHYPDVQSLLLAFDYGHALIYDKLLKLKGSGEKYDPEAVEADLLAEIKSILGKRIAVKSDEDDIAPDYARKFALPLALFDWSHYLHQFTYDALVDSRTPAEVTSRIQALHATYSALSHLAISGRCLSMRFMNSQRYGDKTFSKAFREEFPGLNDLIWAYHWLQIALYRVLVQPAGRSRDTAVADVVAEFRRKVARVPDNFEDMPFMEEVAAEFTRRFPRLANTFDNLHMLHDILGDMLASPVVPARALLSEGRRFARMAVEPPEELWSNRCASERGTAGDKR